MSDMPFDLTEKEAAVLRLLACGHDVKSAAVELGLSVHTVNERLREARRKTGASSSRGAARIFTGNPGPNFSGPAKSGVFAKAAADQSAGQPRHGAADGPRILGRWGVPMMISAMTTIAILAAAYVGGGGPAPVPPHVVSTSPAAGAVVPAGPLVLTVTFDRPMRPGSYSFVQASGDSYPDCGGAAPVQSQDGRSFSLRCRVEAGRAYEVWFNRGEYRNFTDRNGVSAMPHQLLFRAK
ncbi:LuxR C-terminal-related transcriptional regulator [Sphingomonas sp. PB1R3]|uniref:LuxR C-terminal-related transcriptional regulator n=1 Tax=Sphingomonas flavida TaxID=3096154 RepID=UPI002FCC70FC